MCFATICTGECCDQFGAQEPFVLDFGQAKFNLPPPGDVPAVGFLASPPRSDALENFMAKTPGTPFFPDPTPIAAVPLSSLESPALALSASSCASPSTASCSSSASESSAALSPEQPKLRAPKTKTKAKAKKPAPSKAPSKVKGRSGSSTKRRAPKIEPEPVVPRQEISALVQEHELKKQRLARKAELARNNRRLQKQRLQVLENENQKLRAEVDQLRVANDEKDESLRTITANPACPTDKLNPELLVQAARTRVGDKPLEYRDAVELQAAAVELLWAVNTRLRALEPLVSSAAASSSAAAAAADAIEHQSLSGLLTPKLEVAAAVDSDDEDDEEDLDEDDDEDLDEDMELDQLV